MKAAAAKQKGHRKYNMHGLNGARRALMRFGNQVIDKRYRVSRELAKWRADLIQDLGGDVSTQQSAIVDLAITTKLLKDSIDVWLFAQESLVNKRKKSVLPVVLQRQQLADALARYMAQLGLQRKVRVKSLEEILSEGNEEEQP